MSYPISYPFLHQTHIAFHDLLLLLFLLLLKNSYSSMAFCQHSSFPSSEYNSLYSTTPFTSNGRFLGRGMDRNNGGVLMVKLWSNSKSSTHIQLLRNYRLCCGLDSRFSDILSNGRAIFFSLCNIEAVIKSKDRFSLRATVTLIAQRQWSQLVAVALVLACTFVIIPNANAVDALKTCTCLLKKCMYCRTAPNIFLIFWSF